MKVDVFHNIRWSRYKAVVFSNLHEQAVQKAHFVRFFQIADTDGQRLALSGVALDFHRYPHELLFEGSYSDIPLHRLVGRLFREVIATQADLVLLPGYERIEYWAMLFAAMLRGKKRAVFCDSTLRDRPQSRIKGWMKRLFFSRCDGFFAYGVRSGELLRHYGADPRVIFQRCQAAALPESYSESVARSRRLELIPPNETPIFLYVGRLSPEKSLDVLLRSFSMVRQKLGGARLVFVGSGPESEQLKSLSRDLGVSDYVEFAGSKDADGLAHCYAASTCLVLPSRSEPWGLVVNEALHYGCPVVVSDNCGCVPELVRDGETGFVFKTDDVDDLADKMVRLATEFSDPALVADRCQALIAHYTPQLAAAQILIGCESILAVGGKS